MPSLPTHWLALPPNRWQQGWGRGWGDGSPHGLPVVLVAQPAPNHLLRVVSLSPDSTQQNTEQLTLPGRHVLKERERKNVAGSGNGSSIFLAAASGAGSSAYPSLVLYAPCLVLYAPGLVLYASRGPLLPPLTNTTPLFLLL